MEKETEVLCVYGFDPKIKPKKGQRLLILEEEGHQIPSEAFFNPQQRIVILPKEHPDELLKQLAWEYVFLPFSYQEVKKDTRQILQLMAFYEMGTLLVSSDVRDMGFLVLSNILSNIKKLSSSRAVSSLHGSFTDIPAIICGAGPSLEKDLEQLRKVNESALIFAGGSSLNVLKGAGIVPHIGAAIDPDPPKKRQKGQAEFSIPFLYPWRVSKELLSSVKGPLVWVPTTTGQPVEKWLLEQCAISIPPLDAGWNVATFCLAVAYAMGCRTIYLVGMDLAFSGGKAYASGVKEENEREGAVWVKNCEGKEIFTRKDWYMAGSWIDEFAQIHPDLELIDATQKGLGFRNLKKKSLQEFSPFEGNIREKVNASIEQAPLLSERKSETALRELHASWSRCQKLCDTLIGCFQKYYPESPEEKGDFALAEVELSGELAYKKMIEPVWNVWQLVFNRTIDNALGRKLNQILFFKRIFEEGQTIWK